MTLRDKLKFWILLCNYVEKVVSGTSPLTLDSAVANSLFYVKAFGGTEQRNLPDGYIQRQFIYMMDGSYLLTDIVPTYDSKIEFDFQTTSVPSGVFGGILGGRTITYGGLQVLTNYSSGAFVIDAFGTSSTDRYTSTVIAQNNTRYKFTFDNKVATLESGGSVLFTNTFTGTGATGAALAINAVNDNGTISNNNIGIYLYGFKVWNAQGVLVADYVPAIQKGTVPVVGFYDTVSKTFKTATAGTFAAGGESVPTPDAPMDIVSNNGVLKARHESGLPLGYTLLEYIESSGTQYINALYTPSASGYEYEIDVATLAANSAIIGCQSNDALLYASSTGNKVIVLIQGSSASFFVDTVRERFYKHNLSYDGTKYTYKVDGTVIGQQTKTTNPLPYFLFGNTRASGTEVYDLGSIRIGKAKLYNNGILIRNFIPCKNSSNVIGMYDTVSGQFFTNAGTGDFVAGNTVSDPVEIYADGVVETINVHGKNLFDANSDWDFNTSMTYSAPEMGFPAAASGGTRHTFFFKCQPNTTYTISASTYGDRLWVGGLNNIVDPASYTSDNPVVFDTIFARLSSVSDPVTFTTGADTKLVGVYYSLNTLPTNMQIEQGSTATTYEPYYDGGTATAEMLLSIGDYTDEQEIISGVVTRKLGVAVLDGTETWTKNSAGIFACQNLINNISNQDGYCTHFKKVADTTSFGDMPVGTYKFRSSGDKIVYFNYDTSATIPDWTQYLAEQYAAGTPVIIVYPLAEPTTDTVTGQPMNTTAGDNILEITQASLSNLELEAKYKQSK